MQIEGRNPVNEALKSGRQISVVYVQSRVAKSPKVREIVSQAIKKGIRVRKMTSTFLDKISLTSSHQGVIAIEKRKIQRLQEVLDGLYEKGKTPFFVIINEVLYQQNLGAIIRSAECAGCTGVIIPLNTKVTSEAIRASMGAIEYIPVINWNLFNAMKTLKNEGVKIIGLEATGTKTIYEEDLRGGIAILVGGEDRGITPSVLKHCDIVAKIPLFGKINSLNMSNATAVALFEKVRQDRGNGR